MAYMRDRKPSQGGARVSVEVSYGSERLPLGMLGAELLEIDRGLRDAIRRSRRDRAPGSREGWKPVRESIEVVRAETHSPLALEAVGFFVDVLSGLTAAALAGLFKEQILERFKDRRSDDPELEISFEIEIDGKTAKGKISFKQKGRSRG